MDLSIIIVNYNTFNHTKTCINSIITNTFGLKYEIIVVNNNSSDKSAEKLNSYFNSKIKLIDVKENIGLGKANNLASKHSKSGNLLFLNSDIVVIDNSIKHLLNFLESNNDVGIVGGNLHDENMNPTLSFKMKLPTIFGILGDALFKRINLNKKYNFTSKPIKVGYVSGADFMIKKDLFNRVGKFNKKFFLYFEETELTYRIQKIGFHSYSIPTAKFIHIGGASGKERYNKVLNTSNYHLIKSKYIYFSLTKGKASLSKVYIVSQVLNLLLLLKSYKYSLEKIKLERKIYKVLRN